jgi:hypothetical protein
MSEAEFTAAAPPDAGAAPVSRTTPNAFGADVRVETDASGTRIRTWTWPAHQLSETAVPVLLQIIEGMRTAHPGRSCVLHGSVTADHASVSYTEMGLPTLLEVLEAEPLEVHPALVAAKCLTDALEDARSRDVAVGRWDPAQVQVWSEGGWVLPAPGLHALPMGARPLIVTLSEASACAPEVATGAVDLSDCPPDVRDRAEAYAVGATLYYALSGQLPYEADSPERYCRLQLESAPTPLVEAAPHLERHGTVLRLVDRCLERSPESRPESLEALTVELAIAIREAHRLESSGGFFPLRVSDTQGLERPLQRPGVSTEAETAKHNRRQILVLAALVGLLFSLVYYQSHSPGLGVEETPPVIMPAEP